MRKPRSSHRCSGCNLFRSKDSFDRKGWCGHPEAPVVEVVRLDDHCDDWEAYELPAKERRRLPWEYCECGCHGWDLSLGGVYFHLYWDLGDKWFLSREHGISSTRKIYKSAPEAEAVVIEALRKAADARQDERAAIDSVLAKFTDQGDACA